ncbi:MAG: copper chaperone PCu(A)C [Sphingopyxis sp.]
MKAAFVLFAPLSMTTLAALSLSGCSKPAEEAAPEGLKVQSASVRLNPNPAAPSAAYFTIVGGAEAETLTGITSPDAKRVEMHESRMEGGLMTMAPVDHVDIPAGGRIAFRQGGLHVMLFDIEAAVRNGGKLHLLLFFKNGGVVPIEITVPAQSPADATPAESQDTPPTPPARFVPAPHPITIEDTFPTGSGYPAPDPAPRAPLIAGPAPAAPSAPTEMDHSQMGDHDH